MKTKTDSELISEMVEFLYDDFSEAHTLGDSGSIIGKVLIELDRRFCNSENVIQLKKDLRDAEDFRRAETAWINSGK